MWHGGRGPGGVLANDWEKWEAERKEWVAPVSQSGKEKIAEALSFLFRLFSLTHCQFFGKKERKLNHENYSMIRKWRRGSLLMNCPVEMPRHISETWDMELRRFWVQAGAQVKMWPGSNNKRKCGSGNKHQHHWEVCAQISKQKTLVFRNSGGLSSFQFFQCQAPTPN